MKKCLPKIIISLIVVAIFVVPFSAELKINDNKTLIITLETNKVLASSLQEVFGTSWVKIDETKTNSNSTIFSGEIKLPNTEDNCSGCLAKTNNYYKIYDNVSGENGDPGTGIFFVIKENSTEIARLPFSGKQGLGFSFDRTKQFNPFTRNTLDITKLEPNKKYTINIEIKGNPSWLLGLTDYASYESNPVTFTTKEFNANDPTQTNYNTDVKSTAYGEAQDFGCGITNIPGCIAQVFYSLAQAAAWLPRVAGGFLDFFIYYATNSSSYSNQFVEQGWAAVRDIANIFFIVALLFIAIKTILSLNVTDNKKLVGTVIIIALVINFSLFTTKVVIDASNILAKVFYNNITSKDDKGATLTGEGGQKTLSVGIANKFNPQGLAMAVYPLGLGYFIFMTLLLIAISVYTAYIFLSVALLFVARVISLWISMIVSPIAFASYTVPFDIPGFGHKEWWDDLLKNAFLAPLFVFMLYLIILFAGFLSKIVSYTDNPDITTLENIMQHLMSILIPFIIIAMLLTKSKSLAEKYSGEMGKAVMKGAQMVGGVALGAVTGGAAMLGTGLIGGAAAKMAGSENLKEKAKEKGFGGYAARMALKTADKGTKSSFDIRKTAMGGTFSKMSGMDLQSSKMLGLGSKEGGYKGTVERKTKALEEESKLYKTTKTDAQVKEWSQIEQNKYDAKKNEAQEETIKNGSTFNEEDYKKKNGERPKIYNTADQLNKDRTEAFKNNLGQSGLLGTIAYETIKRTGNQVETSEKVKDKNGIEKDNNNYYKKSKEYKKWEEDKEDAKKEAQEKQGRFFDPTTFDQSYNLEHKEPTTESINKARVKTAKMIIGGGTVIAAGGLMGGVIGGALSGSFATGSAMSEGSAEAKFSGQLEKELKKMGDIEERLKEMKELLATQTSILSDGAKLGITTDTGNKDTHGNIIYTTDTNKLTETLAKTAVEEQDLNSQLEALNRIIAEKGENPDLINRKEKLKNDLFESTIKTGKLNALKNIDQTMANTRTQIYNLGGQKSNIKDGGGGNSVPPTPVK